MKRGFKVKEIISILISQGWIWKDKTERVTDNSNTRQFDVQQL